MDGTATIAGMGAQLGSSTSGCRMAPTANGGRRQRSYSELRHAVRLLHDRARAEQAFGEVQKAALHWNAAYQFAREARRLSRELRRSGVIQSV